MRTHELADNLPQRNPFPSSSFNAISQPVADVPKMAPEIRSRYQDILRDPTYAHFTHIPDRIIRCLEYFGIDCDRKKAHERLLAYYLFIGVIDNSMDSGEIGIGDVVLEQLSRSRESWALPSDASNVSIATMVLKHYVNDEIHSLALFTFRQLYAEVMRERTVTSMSKYIETRREIGRLTARISYLLIQPLLNGDHEPLGRFMERVGQIGCLVDSVIDLQSDWRLDLLSFRPRPIDFVRLTVCTLRDGLRLSIEYPRLLGLFAQSIADNLQDRFRMPERQPESIVSSGKDATTSAASTVW